MTCVVNLPPRNTAGFRSEILILGARDAAGNAKLMGPSNHDEIGAVFRETSEAFRQVR